MKARASAVRSVFQRGDLDALGRVDPPPNSLLDVEVVPDDLVRHVVRQGLEKMPDVFLDVAHAADSTVLPLSNDPRLSGFDATRHRRARSWFSAWNSNSLECGENIFCQPPEAVVIGVSHAEARNDKSSRWYDQEFLV